MADAKVIIIMGSDSDFETMKSTVDVLAEFGVPNEVVVASAHRAPYTVERIAREAEARGVKLFIAAAGMAAHLPGVVAAFTSLPVIGVPMEAGALKGVDALYAIVQMPGGIPVMCMGIGKHGATNAGYAAVAILANDDAALKTKLHAYRSALPKKIEAANQRVQEQLGRSPAKS